MRCSWQYYKELNAWQSNRNEGKKPTIDQLMLINLFYFQNHKNMKKQDSNKTATYKHKFGGYF